MIWGTYVVKNTIAVEIILLTFYQKRYIYLQSYRSRIEQPNLTGVVLLSDKPASFPLKHIWAGEALEGQGGQGGQGGVAGGGTARELRGTRLRPLGRSNPTATNSASSFVSIESFFLQF